MAGRLRVTGKSQRGFTLSELLIALAITGVIVGAIAMATFQLVSSSTMTANHIVTVKQVENGFHWLSRDAQMAQIVQANGSSGFPLNLTWVDWDNNSNNVTYSVQAGELRRAYSVNGHQPTTSVVAQHINADSAMTNCQFAGDTLTFKITVSVGGFKPASKTRTGQVVPKPR